MSQSQRQYPRVRDGATTSQQPVRVESHLVITVHGIRTFGQWQDRLLTLLKTANEQIEVVNYRYGYFSVVAFMIPFLRWLVTRRFRRDLLYESGRADWQRIDIVAHSFGTHLAGWGLYGVPADRRPKIHTIILAGSVLKAGFPWRDLMKGCVGRVVNDCGVNDWVLVMNQLLVLFTGMAGRFGFNGMTGERFRNRFFLFGHSGYFVKEGDFDEDIGFMQKYWVPLLTTHEPSLSVDNRKPPKALQGFVAWALNNAEPIKLVIYILPVLLFAAYVNGLRVEAEGQAAIAEMNRILAEQQKDIAEMNFRDKELETYIAGANEVEAERQQRLAEDRQRDAERQRRRAEENFGKLTNAMERNSHSINGLAALQRKNHEDALGEFQEVLKKVEKEISSSTITATESKELTQEKGWTLSNIGTAQRELGQFKESVDSFEQALTLQRNENNWLLFDTRYGLARAYYGLADRVRQPHPNNSSEHIDQPYDKAQQQYNAAQDLEEKLLQGTPVARLDAGLVSFAELLEGAARLHRDRGAYDKAEPYYSRIIEIRKHLQSPEYVKSLKEAAQFYESLHKYAEAENLYEQVFAWQGQYSLENIGRELADSYVELGRIYLNESFGVSDEARKKEKQKQAQDSFVLASQFQDLEFRYRTAGLDADYFERAGVLYTTLKKYATAGFVYQRALERLNSEVNREREQAPQVFTGSAAYQAQQRVRLAFARLLVTYLKAYNGAEQYYQLVIQTLDRDMNEQNANRDIVERYPSGDLLASVRSELAALYANQLNKPDEAPRLLDLALSHWEKAEVGLLDSSELDGISRVYRQLGNDTGLERVLKLTLNTQARRLRNFVARWSFLDPTFSKEKEIAKYLEAGANLVDFYGSRGSDADVAALSKQFSETHQLIMSAIWGDVALLDSYLHLLENYRSILQRRGRSIEADTIGQKTTEIRDHREQISRQRSSRPNNQK